jgi:aryl-alcohol dehydrogenase-like predicted oxidoreductase
MLTPPAPALTIGGELTVGRIGYGAMKLTGEQVWGEYPDRNGAVALLRAALQAGVTFIDTADVYGPHTNELLIRDALHPYPGNLVIATKGGFVRGGFDYSTLGAVGYPNYLRQCAHLSARRLGVDQLDLYYLHSGQATDTPFQAQVETLAALREEGLIRHIGLSNVTLEQLRAAQAITPIAAVTAHYNLAVRTGADLLRAAEQHGIAFSPWHPVTLTEGTDPQRLMALVEPIADRHGVSARQVALAWHLRRSRVSLPIPGTTSIAHLRENLAATRVILTEDEVTQLTDLTPEA